MKTPIGHHILEVFLRQVESGLFKAIERPLEWNAIRSPADDRNMVIKRAYKRSFVVTCDRNDYVK